MIEKKREIFFNLLYVIRIILKFKFVNIIIRKEDCRLIFFKNIE